jgi:hypothetical protein
MAKQTTPKVHHYVRTTVAAILGSLALLLVSASVLIVWANRTLTDTPTFVSTLGPVIERPELQDFVATKITTQLLDSAPTQDLASQLLTADQVAGKTPDQLKVALTPAIHSSVVEIMQSPKVESTWMSVLSLNHAELLRQLDAGAQKVTINAGPLVDAALFEMKRTKLAPVADKIEIEPSKATIELAGKPLERIRQVYGSIKTATLVIVLLTLVLAGLSIWASVHHAKTVRRMLTMTGVSSLLVAGLIAWAPHAQIPGADPTIAKLAVAVAGTLLHGLQMGCLVLGVTCIVLAVGYKLVDRPRLK